MRTEKQLAHNSCYHTNSPSVKVNWIWWIGLGFHATWTRLCMEFHLFFVLNQIMHVSYTCTSTWTFSENKWNTIKFAKAHITFKIWASTKQKVEILSNDNNNNRTHRPISRLFQFHSLFSSSLLIVATVLSILGRMQIEWGSWKIVSIDYYSFGSWETDFQGKYLLVARGRKSSQMKEDYFLPFIIRHVEMHIH